MVDFSKAASSVISDFTPYITDIPDFPIDGVTFKDIQPLLADPKAFRQAIFEMFCKFETDLDYWVGIDSRGFIFASGLSEVFLVLIISVKFSSFKGPKCPKNNGLVLFCTLYP